jgi:hypothetical protein
VCTQHLTVIFDAPFLMPLSSAFMIIAIAAWMATFVGLVDSHLNARSRAHSLSEPDAAG